MIRREIVLRKLHELSSEEVADAIRQLTYHVQARMRLNSFFDRTKTGAHSEKYLGMNAVDFYVGESVKDCMTLMVGTGSLRSVPYLSN